MSSRVDRRRSARDAERGELEIGKVGERHLAVKMQTDASGREGSEGRLEQPGVKCGRSGLEEVTRVTRCDRRKWPRGNRRAMGG